MNKKTALFITTGLVMMLFGVTMVVVGTINNYLTVELKAGKAIIGICASVLASGILAGTFVFGPVADRKGFKLLIVSGILMIMAGIAGIIFSRDISFVPYLFFLIGLGGGMINGVTNLIVANIYPENSSAWLSLLGVFYGVGALGFPLFTSVLLNFDYTYQTILTIVEFIMLLPLLLALATRFPQPGRSKYISAREYLGFFVRPAILLFGFFLFFQSALESIIPVWVPTFLTEFYGADYSKALFAITVTALGLSLTRLALGYLLKKWSPLVILFISMFTVLAGLVVLEFGGSFYIGLAGVGLAGIGLAASFPVILSYTAAFYPDGSGTAFSIVIGIGLFGNILLNALTGIVLERFGTANLNIILISCIVLMVILLKIIHYKLMSFS